MSLLRFRARALWSALVAALAALTVVLVAPAPAHAADLPIGTYLIRNVVFGHCAEVNPSLGYAVVSRPCDSSNLNQRWAYNLITKDLLSVGQLTRCLTYSSVNISVLPCDFSDGQKWGRFITATDDSVLYPYNRPSSEYMLRADQEIGNLWGLDDFGSPVDGVRMTFQTL